MSKRTGLTRVSCWGMVLLLACGAQAGGGPYSTDDQTMLLMHFDGNANDASAFVCQATTAKTLSFDAGRFGSGLACDGTTWLKVLEKADAGNLDFVGNKGPLTIELWLKPKAHHDWTISLVQRGNGAPWSLHVSKGQVGFTQWAPGRWAGTTYKTALTLDKWQHIALTVDSTNLLTSIFIDGRLVHRDDLASALSYSEKNQPVWIAGLDDANSAKFQGLIDELRISRCIRYDPKGTAKIGERVFEVSQ